MWDDNNLLTYGISSVMLRVSHIEWESAWETYWCALVEMIELQCSIQEQRAAQNQSRHTAELECVGGKIDSFCQLTQSLQGNG